MTTDFMEKMKPFLTISKLCGLLNVSYTLENGLLSLDITSRYYLFLELMRTCVIIMCTYYMVYTKEYVLISYFNVVKYWSIFITARIMERRIIKFVNDVIQFDHKLLIFRSLLTIDQSDQSKLLSKTFCKIIFISFFLYYFLVRIYFLFYFTYPKSIFDLIINLWFHSPDMFVFVVTISSCFYLCNLRYRFRELNSLWLRLPSGLVAVPCKWTNSEITSLVERIRLLYSELSELVRLFSLGYGPVILVFFVFTYINTIIDILIVVKFGKLSKHLGFAPYIFIFQYVSYMLAILSSTSWLNKEKKKIISLLRLNRLVGMSPDTKLQVRMFMNQISAYELNEMTAFGFFNFDLKIVVSMLVLMITVISTLVQMKDQPFIQKLHDALFIPLTNLINMPNA